MSYKISAGNILTNYNDNAGEVLLRYQSMENGLSQVESDSISSSNFDCTDGYKHSSIGAITKENTTPSVAFFCKDVVDSGPGGSDYSDEESNGDSKAYGDKDIHVSYKAKVDYGHIENKFMYDMNHTKRGLFVIFNQMEFDARLNFAGVDNGYREGSNKDAEILERTARDIGFEFVRIFPNFNRSQIDNLLEKLSGANHEEYDCFVCAILTHGSKGDILYARDGEMQIKDFTSPFNSINCPSLAGKPKLFFVQACRGVNVDPGHRMIRPMQVCSDAYPGDEVDANLDDSDSEQSKEEGQNEVIIPSEADFLIAHSTASDHYSFRNKDKGAIYIRNLCAALLQFRELEITQILTRVNKMIAYDYLSSAANKKHDKKKQIPSFCSQLTAELFFSPKNAYENIIPKTVTEVDSSHSYNGTCQTYKESNKPSKTFFCQDNNNIAVSLPTRRTVQSRKVFLRDQLFNISYIETDV